MQKIALVVARSALVWPVARQCKRSALYGTRTSSRPWRSLSKL